MEIMTNLPKKLISLLLDKTGSGLDSLQKISHKEALVQVLIEREAQRHLRVLEEKYSTIRDEPFEKKIEILIQCITDAMFESKTGIKILLTSTFAVDRLEALIMARKSLITFIETVLIESGHEKEAKKKAHLIVASLGGVVETIVFKKDDLFSRDELINESTKLVHAYVKA
jgi:hypothetical protein